jgi:hypothetical protein
MKNSFRDPWTRKYLYLFMFLYDLFTLFYLVLSHLIVIPVDEETPPLWSSGQGSWLQIQRPGSIPGAIKFSEK